MAAPPPPAPAAAPAAAGSAAEALVPLPQLLGLESYNPNSLLGTFLPRAVLERRCACLPGGCRERDAAQGTWSVVPAT